MTNENLSNTERSASDIPIPGNRSFTLGEVSELCEVKPHVLRYWEQEFPQLKPVKRGGNRRYYERHDVLLIREIRSLLYEQGFTIGGARQHLQNSPLLREEDISAYADSKIWLDKFSEDLEEDFRQQEIEHEKRNEVFSRSIVELKRIRNEAAE